MEENFSKNLRLLCSYYKSIAEVCRRIPINRSQFNKYLNGTSTPSRFILRSICDFFGVEEYEIYLPHSQFAQIVQVECPGQLAGGRRWGLGHMSNSLEACGQG